MKEVNSPNGFRNKKSFGRGMLQHTIQLKGPTIWRLILRIAIVAVLVAAFLITYAGILDPRRAASKPLSDNELRELLTTMRIPLPTLHPPGSENARLAALGKKLFFDTRLSANGQVACATCHQPQKSFTDGKAVAAGTGTTTRNAPTILNSHLSKWFFWDGRADSLEAQAIGPLENPKEHGLDRKSLARLLRLFYGQELSWEGSKLAPERKDPFVAPITDQNVAAYFLGTTNLYSKLSAILKLASSSGMQPSQAVAQMMTPTIPAPSEQEDNAIVAQAAIAIAAWERLQVAAESPFDEFIETAIKDPTRPLNEVARTTKFGQDGLDGLRLFTGKANCILCHRGPTLSDNEFHNIGLGENRRHHDQLGIKEWVADVAGRAKGIQEAVTAEWNCRSPFWGLVEDEIHLSKRVGSATCQELGYLDASNAENVGAFKTPTLRNVNQTAPYFHDGRAATLEEVLTHYDRLESEPVVGHREESLQPLGLGSDEKRQLHTFLESLSSPVRDLGEAQKL
jgi:cytochrome c peroxidase